MNKQVGKAEEDLSKVLLSGQLCNGEFRKPIYLPLSFGICILITRNESASRNQEIVRSSEHLSIHTAKYAIKECASKFKVSKHINSKS